MRLEDWQAEGRRLFGDDVNQWRFKCPSCGHIQKRQDYLDMGMGKQCDNYLAFTCIGKFRRTDPTKTIVGYGDPDKGHGCKYAGGGLFNISPIQLVIGPDEVRPTFAFDTNGT
jgi:hypothetical protein